MVSITPRPRFTPGENNAVHIVQEAGWAPEPVWTQRLEEKSSASVGDQTPVVQSVVSHYTDWATRFTDDAGNDDDDDDDDDDTQLKLFKIKNIKRHRNRPLRTYKPLSCIQPGIVL
jgi:hypothetical protein